MASTRKPLRERARDRWRKYRSHTCSCGARDCKGYYRTVRELNAHHIRHLPRWTSDKARKMARKIGKKVCRACWAAAQRRFEEKARRAA